MITPPIARKLFEQHEEYWNDKRPEMRRLRNAYLMRYWQRSIAYDDSLLIETSRAYELIESYIASLFVRDPAVVVKPDLRGRGDPLLTEEVANHWLMTARRQIEDALRLSLIYPWAGMKLSATDTRDPLRRVEVTPIGPWDVVVDDAASSWATQRFVGHRYYVPIDVAKEKYGNKKYSKRTFSRYIDYQDENEQIGAYRRDEDPITKDITDYILVVEFYDLTDDKLLVWSPDYQEGRKFLYDGIELAVGSDDEEEPELEKFDGIPFRTQSDRPIVPIVPLFMSREPDEPLRGYSALRRVYDQVVEVNTIRTFQANGIRRAARQWLVEKGILSEESMSKIAQGQDGEFIEVELTNGQNLQASFMPVPHSPVPPELQTYEQQVEDDFGRGSILAPFTRGEATKATATEITALAAYSSSEVGRMARERDAAIAAIAEAYVVMLATLMGEDPVIMRLSGGAQALTPDDLTGDFGFFAVDSGSTPMSEAVAKQELMTLVPVLQALGVANETILKNLVRVYGLTEEFLPQQAPAVPNMPQMPPGAAGTPAEMLPQAGVAPGKLPAPGQVKAMLPDGGVV